MTCRKCKSDRAYRTERKGAVDGAFNRIDFKPYLCAGCNARFHAYTPGPRMETLGPRLRKLRRSRSWRREMLIFAIAAAIVAGIIYLIVQQRVGQ